MLKLKLGNMLKNMLMTEYAQAKTGEYPNIHNLGKILRVAQKHLRDNKH